MKKRIRLLEQFKGYTTYAVPTLFVFIFHTVLSLEETQPSINLSPRNFNPHPYQHRLIQEQRNLRNNGPVVFPTNPEDEQVLQNPGNVIVVEGKIENNRNRLVDEHPYSKVARKHERILDDRQEESRAKKNYKFSYKVFDHFSGDDFSHRQFSNARATNGEYRVKLPDGRNQVVSYVADVQGYKADVKYEPDNEIVQQQIIPKYYDTDSGSVDVQRIPVRELKTIRPHYRIFDGNNALKKSQLSDQNLFFLEKVGPTVIPVRYIDVTPTASPYLHREHVEPINHGLQRFTTTPVPAVAYPKVQIFTSNARDYLSAGYIPTTIAPYVLSNAAVMENPNGIRPEIVNNGDHGLYSPVSQRISDEVGIIPTTVAPLLVYATDLGKEHQIITPTAAPYQLNNGGSQYDKINGDYQEEYGIFYVNPEGRRQRGLKS